MIEEGKREEAFRFWHGWGGWEFDSKCMFLYFKKNTYVIDLKSCDTASGILDWLYQLKGKAWDAEILNLMQAFDDITGGVQSLCHFGEHERFNVKKHIKECVIPLMLKYQEK